MRIVSAVLLLTVVGMLLAWQPWTADAQDDNRTISVTGETKFDAEPDEFVFYPAYEFREASKEAGLEAIGSKANEVTEGLKAFGVNESRIKVNSDSYDYPSGAEPAKTPDGPNYTLRLTITINSRETAQKVQDYLLSTNPVGQISPQASFSDAKRKELEGRARDEATKDARAKAEQSAKNLGFAVGKVKSISDGATDGIIYPLMQDARNGSAEARSLPVQPGENEFRYSVTVTYYIR